MISHSDNSSSREASTAEKKTWLVATLLLYSLLQIGVFWGLGRARQWTLDQYASEEAQKQWDRWVDEAQRQAEGDGPVARRVPKSKEPPALVLMRDHYPTCAAGAWLFSTLLFSVLSYFAWGLSRPSTAAVDGESAIRESVDAEPVEAAPVDGAAAD